MKIKSIIIHVFIWGFLICWNLFDTYRSNHDYYFPWVIFLTYLNFSFVFYGYTFFILPRYFKTVKIVKLILASLSLWILFLLFDYWLETRFEVQYYTKVPFEPNLLNYVSALSFYFVYYAAFGFGYYYLRKSLLQQRSLRLAAEISSQQLAVIHKQEEQKLQLENSFLRAQINPHFLFNLLNYLIETARGERSRKLAYGLETVSSIMRYSLKQPGADGQVELEEEVVHIEKLFEMYRFRYGEGLFAELERKGSTKGLRIVPHVLITLVENAFKHGQLHNPAEPIRVCLNISGNKLEMTTSNSIQDPDKKVGLGAGLDNVRKRLEYAYPNNFELEIFAKENSFFTSLSVFLSYLPNAEKELP